MKEGIEKKRQKIIPLNFSVLKNFVAYLSSPFHRSNTSTVASF